MLRRRHDNCHHFREPFSRLRDRSCVIGVQHATYSPSHARQRLLLLLSNYSSITELEQIPYDGFVQAEAYYSSTTRNAAVKNTLNSSGDRLQPCRSPCVTSVIRTNPSPHAVVEITDNSQHLGWYAKASEYLP